MDNAANLVSLPDDSQALKAMLRTLMRERDEEEQRADHHAQRAEQYAQRAEQEARQSNELRAEMLRLQLELERYKKWY